ncbi:hypothetical protein [Paenibacillus sp. SN-8-1]|uniref:hypothetical protein n=1 Tax=Paenibacillus sp. SN-8-1 TaxID=3435409 RepID=UPI003D9A2207
MPSHDVQLIAAYRNCVARGATKEQLEAFIERCREQWAGDTAMLAVVNGLQNH